MPETLYKRRERGHLGKPIPQEGPGRTLRALIPPLTVIIGLLTALALVLTAAAITPTPVPVPLASPSRATAVLAADGSPDAVSLTGTLLVHDEPVALPSEAAMLGLTRLTYQPGTGGSGRALPGPVLFTIAPGTLMVTIAGPAHLQRQTGTTEPARGPLLIQAGDGLMLPGATTVAVRNAGMVPAVALVANVFPGLQ